jgi:hypothetical protein
MPDMKEAIKFKEDTEAALKKLKARVDKLEKDLAELAAKQKV